VVKHILNKHGEKLEQHKDAIRDELYWERYEQSKLAAREAQRKAAKEREAAAAAVAAAQGGNEVAGAEAADWQVGLQLGREASTVTQTPYPCCSRAYCARIRHSGAMDDSHSSPVLLQLAWLLALGLQATWPEAVCYELSDTGHPKQPLAPHVWLRGAVILLSVSQGLKAACCLPCCPCRRVLRVRMAVGLCVVPCAGAACVVAPWQVAVAAASQLPHPLP